MSSLYCVSLRKCVTGLAGLAASIACTPAHADTYTLNVQYYTVTPGGDFGTQCCSTSTDLVKAQLGPSGLPVYNPSASNGGFVLTDLDANGQLTWWSPTLNSRVTASGTGTITTPVSDASFYPPDGSGTSDANGFLTAVFSGVMTLPVAETVSFTFGGDDDMFLYVDGQIVGQLGGVHGFETATPTTALLSAGDHTFTAFYADRAQTGAQTFFTINTAGLTVSPNVPGVPEPASWALMLLGFGGIGSIMRRSRKLAVA
jgi:fibro-slime domain-containing protein